MHDQAAMIFEHALSVDPSMADDPTFARLREESLKRLGSNEKIAPKKIVDKAKNIESAKKIGKFFGVAAVLAVFAYLTLSMIQGQRQTIYVVNGLPQAYTVSINGKALQLKPLAVTKARVPQGTVTIASTDPLLPTQSQTAVISTSFLTRPFDDHAFVFNPDHAAIISRIRAVYTVRSAKDPGVPQMRTYFAGQFFHPFDNIDFPFEPFPESMEMSEHQDELVKFGLVQVNETSRMKFPTILQLIGAKLDDVQRLEVARQRFLAEPTESGYLDLIEDLSSHEDYLALLKPLLDRRPLLMNCHRYYQNALRMTDESASMVASYESMLAADSGNKDLMYLVARVIGHKDVARGISLCKAASQSPDPSAYALFWMAGYCLEMGEFDHALQYGKQALAMPTHIAGLEDIYAEALLGAGRHDEALTLFKAIQQRPVSQGGVAGFYQETYLHLAMGNQAEAQNILSALRAKLKGFDPRDVKSIMESLEAGMAYCMGDLEKYIAYSNETKSTSQNCAGHLTAGDLASAHADVQAKDAHYVEHLLVYIVATLKGQSEIAEKELASAIQMMVTTCDGEQMYANALAGKEVGPIEQLLQQRAGRGAKVVILTALGLHDPKAREACFAMVKKLDISKRYPHRIIEDAMTYSQAN
jgi:tetratricopeptide (TPR) repeat protein